MTHYETDPKLSCTRSALKMTKQGGKITLDFTANKPIAIDPGSINWPPIFRRAFLSNGSRPIPASTSPIIRASPKSTSKRASAMCSRCFFRPGDADHAGRNGRRATTRAPFVLRFASVAWHGGPWSHRRGDGRMPGIRKPSSTPGFFCTDLDGKSFLSREGLGRRLRLRPYYGPTAMIIPHRAGSRNHPRIHEPTRFSAACWRSCVANRMPAVPTAPLRAGL